MSLSSIKTISRVFLREYGIQNINYIEEDFKINEKDIKDDEFVAKIYASPINPLDMNKVIGKVRIRIPFIPGSECSGKIIYSKNQKLIGRNIAFMPYNGAYQSIGIGSLKKSILLPDQIDLNQAACAIINPMTCFGMLDITKSMDCNTIINTAANSALGQMIYRLFIKNNVQVINLVRSQDRVEEFKKIYSPKYILDIKDYQFIKQFEQLCYQLDARVCWDCYGGSVSGSILNSMPQQSTSFIYGSMIDTQIQNIDGINLRFNDKSLRGYNLQRWMSKLPNQKLEEIKKIIISHLGDIFKTEIKNIYPIQDIKEAFNEASKYEGKILLRISDE